MTSKRISVELHGGWSCSFHVQQTASGDYSGLAEIALDGLRLGEVVIMQQPSLEAAIARARLRSGHFVSSRMPVAVA
ncbi:hypothetical protein DBV14_14665 [Variovorax sp. KBW07]|uniref:hypothetical protein n=1 Tax=Variovorax sp. KBW07 TaxID=2153358 RepID=UPI000F55C1B8|nr:hypothetical protein [Variovorax sp. KBW07]RQO53272.1 hypothetical protein DBV14_14665 [Variovorax sp. KBW07]